MSGCVAISGKAEMRIRPVSVLWILRPFLVKKPRLNSNSIMPARVASVPSPSVSRRIFFNSLSCTKRAIPVIAESNVASVKGFGGCVFLLTTSPRSQYRICPFFTIGNNGSWFSSSSSLPSSSFQPAVCKLRAWATKVPPAILKVILLLRYSASGQNCNKYWRAISS